MIRKKKLEDHWSMMRWLVKYIEENRYTWERRRQIEEEERELNAAYEDWLAKDREAQIEEMKAKKQKYMDTEMRKQLKKEKAEIRKRAWKEWRKPGENGSGTRTNPREDVRELPEHANTPHNTEGISEKLGGDETGWEGAYQEPHGESTAPCNTGPHFHLEEVLEPGEKREDEEHPRDGGGGHGDGGVEDEENLRDMIEREDNGVENGDKLIELDDKEEKEEMIEMESMLGMTQEERKLCLLCLMPRCICHLTIALDIIETKLDKLRKSEKEVQERNKEEDEGNLGGLLEGGGLTHIEEGSPSPQEPAGDPEPNSKEDRGAIPVQRPLLSHKAGLGSWIQEGREDWRTIGDDEEDERNDEES